MSEKLTMTGVELAKTMYSRNGFVHAAYPLRKFLTPAGAKAILESGSQLNEYAVKLLREVAGE